MNWYNSTGRTLTGYDTTWILQNIVTEGMFQEILAHFLSCQMLQLYFSSCTELDFRYNFPRVIMGDLKFPLF